MANSDPTPKLENLTPWRKGQSGNPEGYSQGRRISDRIIKIINERGLDDKIAEALLGAALGDESMLQGLKPSAPFFSMLLDRVEGKVKEEKIETEDKTSPVVEAIREAVAKAKSD